MSLLSYGLSNPYWEDTLVIWGGEFGRMPTAQGKDGRDHNPHASPSEWLVAVFLESSAMVPPMSNGYYALRDNKVHRP